MIGFVNYLVVVYIRISEWHEIISSLGLKLLEGFLYIFEA